MIVGIGTDIVMADRIGRSLERYGERFAERVLSPAELLEYRQRKDSVKFVAKRFAAKEAVAKAFGTGIGKDLAFIDMNIMRKPSGEPEVQLTGDGAAFAEANKISMIKISLTHAEHYAAANAVALTK